MMKELMMNEDFADVTLVTEDKKQIKANATILSACSPVFKDVFKKDNRSSTIMYLRGIQYSEMEPIMQFIYLGEATFYEERMDEFLAVAKLLEIKELCNAESETNYEQDFKLTPQTSTNEVEEETTIFDHREETGPQKRRRAVVNVKSKYECEQCHKTYSGTGALYNHKQSVHEGVKYACDQCNSQFTVQGSLTQHIQSKHEGVKYACDQCNYQATQHCNLRTHIQSKHDYIKYDCDYCDHEASSQSSLIHHVKNKHAGIKRK